MKSNFLVVTGLIILSVLTLHTSTAQAADHWEKVGDMLHPRLDHTATLLQNGKVLVLGGDFPDAELYNPENHTFQTTGALSTYGLRGGTATLLQNGKVLIAGGINSQQGAMLYDPQTGSFKSTDSLEVPHSFHTATLLADGRVLIAGGQDQNGPQTHAVCEIYDPQSETFSLADSLYIDRSCHTATLLINGQVLIVGGFQTSTPGNGMNINSCEIYDPVSGVFGPVQNMSVPRACHGATLLADGSVLISGGAWNNRYCERYDVSADSWSQTGDMTVIRRSSHTATRLHNGKVLLAGGYSDAVASSAELYDPATNAFTAVDSMFTPREQHAAAILLDGNVLVTGGYSTAASVNLAELYIVDASTGVGVDNQKNSQQAGPESIQLLQNYPNPFNPLTTIKFILPQGEFVNLTIYNNLGKKIQTLLNEKRSSGIHTINFDGKDLPSGLYFYKIVAGSFVSTKKLLLIK